MILRAASVTELGKFVEECPGGGGVPRRAGVSREGGGSLQQREPCTRTLAHHQKKETTAVLPGVLLWPVTTASPVTGCSQLVLFASSLLVKKTEGERGRVGGGQRPSKRRVPVKERARVICT